MAGQKIAEFEKVDLTVSNGEASKPRDIYVDFTLTVEKLVGYIDTYDKDKKKEAENIKKKKELYDTYLRSKVIEHLQSVKPDYYEKEEKGVFLAYLSKELLAIRKFLGNAFFNISRLIVAPIIGLVVIGVNFNPILSLSIIPIIPLAVYRLYNLKKKQQEALENERKVYINLSNTIEQNTSGFQLIKLYNEQENHHRVKNNLQTIASLLRLQARRSNSMEVKEALKESVNRILSIEVKNGKKPINVNDIVQVQRYVTSEGQRFAILSNGYEYVLLDFDIKPAYNREKK